MKQLFIKNWRHIALTSALLLCLIAGVVLILSGSATRTVESNTKAPQNSATVSSSAEASKTAIPDVESTSDTAEFSQATSKTSSNSGTTASATSTGSSSSIDTSAAALSSGGNTSASTPQLTSLSVKLQINGKTAGEVTVASNANQCDVLSEALNQGVISDLDMRYFSSLSSYGVYVINGQGDHDVIWWAYTVNGKSPPVGCSKQGVSGGETINWIYTGK